MTHLRIVSVLVGYLILAACGGGSSSSGGGPTDTAPFEGFYGGTYRVELRSLTPLAPVVVEEGTFALVVNANGAGTVTFGGYGSTDVQLLREANEILVIFSTDPVLAAPNCRGRIILRLTFVEDMVTGGGGVSSQCDNGEYLTSVEVVAQRGR